MGKVRGDLYRAGGVIGDVEAIYPANRTSSCGAPSSISFGGRSEIAGARSFA
ncbi:MAG: hypothetical protein ACRD3S_02580 [Terracidiphilus sp.]